MNSKSDFIQSIEKKYEVQDIENSSGSNNSSIVIISVKKKVKPLERKEELKKE